MPGRELFGHLCPYLDGEEAPESCQRQVGLPGEELFCHLCPYLDGACATEDYLDCKTSGNLLDIYHIDHHHLVEIVDNSTFVKNLPEHLDEACAIEGRQRPMIILGEELFRRLCPHLNKAGATESWSQPKSGKRQSSEAGGLAGQR